MNLRNNIKKTWDFIYFEHQTKKKCFLYDPIKNSFHLFKNRFKKEHERKKTEKLLLLACLTANKLSFIQNMIW